MYLPLDLSERSEGGGGMGTEGKAFLNRELNFRAIVEGLSPVGCLFYEYFGVCVCGGELQL